MKNNLIEFDQLLSSAGEFGLYQVRLLISTLPFYWFGAFSYFSQLFMTEVSPNHWCWIPELANLSQIERRKLAIPDDTTGRFGYSQCYQYVANWTEVIAEGKTSSEQYWRTETCQNGWEYNKTEIPYATISSEMDWVCTKNSYQATAQSIFFLGSIVGGFLIGWVSDYYGRIPAIVFSNMIGCVAGISSIFAKELTQFAICRFFMGISYDNCMMMVYLLVLEYVAPKYRTMAANLPFAIFFSSALVTLPWIALACGDWRIISLATSIPMSLSLLTPFVIPESPRWLLSKGRVAETVNKVLSIGRINKNEVPEHLVEEFQLAASITKIEEKTNIWMLLKIPLLRRMFIIICLDYMCCMIVFDCLVRTISQLNFDIFLSFTIVSLTEFPSIILVSFILDWSGRKWMTFVVLWISSLFSFFISFVESGFPSVACAVVARFAVNMACNTCMQWAAEMLPTPVRGAGVSIVHIFGYIGTVMSPFIVYLGIYEYWIPFVIMGMVAAFGALSSLHLPETVGRDMPQTFSDAEYLIKSQGIFEFPCIKKQKNANNLHIQKCNINDSFEMS